MTLEYIKKSLDWETQTATLLKLPGDFYSRISDHSLKLRRSAGSSTSEVANHLISRQIEMIISMTRQILAVRTKKATQQRALLQLLPEERYVCFAQERFLRRFEALVEAVSTGRPSYIEFSRKRETERCLIVRFIGHVDELVGLDLKRYGPFEAEDVASLPAANASILIAGGDAVEIYTREEEA